MGFLRTLLMWLLVLAVPAQGASAATMAFCGPGHHGAVQVLHDGDPGSADAHTHHTNGVSVDHEHPKADTDEAGSSGVSVSGKVIHHVKHKCSACASCCAAAALPSAFIALPTPILADSFLPLAPRSVASVPIDGVERPPRSLLV